MKKLIVFSLLLTSVFVFSYCSSAKKAAAAKEAAKSVSVYSGNVESVIMNSCVPCHIPAKGGNKAAFDSYASVKANIDEIIRRVELNPTDRGFMPFKKTVKLSDSTINIFKQWKADGTVEK